MPKANAFRVAVRPVVLGACLAQLCGLASAGDQVQDLDFFILVDRSASGFFATRRCKEVKWSLWVGGWDQGW